MSDRSHDLSPRQQREDEPYNPYGLDQDDPGQRRCCGKCEENHNAHDACEEDQITRYELTRRWQA